MAINPADAIAAYSAAKRNAAAAPAVPDPTQGAGRDSSFSSMVKGTLEQSVANMRQGEEMSIQAIAGKADLRDVVVAVANAEVTLETVVSVRDKVVNAYNEIMKMPM